MKIKTKSDNVDHCCRLKLLKTRWAHSFFAKLRPRTIYQLNVNDVRKTGHLKMFKLFIFISKNWSRIWHFPAANRLRNTVVEHLNSFSKHCCDV